MGNTVPVTASLRTHGSPFWEQSIAPLCLRRKKSLRLFALQLPGCRKLRETEIGRKTYCISSHAG